MGCFIVRFNVAVESQPAALINDFVTFSGATGLGGNITDTVLNKEYQITVTGVDSYTFVATATANATDAAAEYNDHVSTNGRHKHNVYATECASKPIWHSRTATWRNVTTTNAKSVQHTATAKTAD